MFSSGYFKLSFYFFFCPVREIQTLVFYTILQSFMQMLTFITECLDAIVEYIFVEQKEPWFKTEKSNSLKFLSEVTAFSKIHQPDDNPIVI